MNIPIEINAIFADPHTEAQIVILQDRHKQAFLPIWIGASEAHSIRLAMENIAVPRPLTHDLLKSFLTHLNIKLEKVVIRDVQRNTYYASLYFKPICTPIALPTNVFEKPPESLAEDIERTDTEGALETSPTKFKIDARPSDAIVLSLRYGTPMYVSKKVLEHQKVPPGFSAWLARADAKDSESSYSV